MAANLKLLDRVGHTVLAAAPLNHVVVVHLPRGPEEAEELYAAAKDGIRSLNMAGLFTALLQPERRNSRERGGSGPGVLFTWHGGRHLVLPRKIRGAIADSGLPKVAQVAREACSPAGDEQSQEVNGVIYVQRPPLRMTPAQARHAIAQAARRCQKCDSPATKRCSLCMGAAYCSQACQTADWVQHKTACGASAAVMREAVRQQSVEIMGLLDMLQLATTPMAPELCRSCSMLGTDANLQTANARLTDETCGLPMVSMESDAIIVPELLLFLGSTPAEVDRVNLLRLEHQDRRRVAAALRQDPKQEQLLNVFDALCSARRRGLLNVLVLHKQTDGSFLPTVFSLDDVGLRAALALPTRPVLYNCPVRLNLTPPARSAPHTVV